MELLGHTGTSSVYRAVSGVQTPPTEFGWILPCFGGSELGRLGSLADLLIDFVESDLMNDQAAQIAISITCEMANELRSGCYELGADPSLQERQALERAELFERAIAEIRKLHASGLTNAVGYDFALGRSRIATTDAYREHEEAFMSRDARF